MSGPKSDGRSGGSGKRRRRSRRRPRSVEAADLGAIRKIVSGLDALARSVLRRELLDQAPTRPVGDLPLELTIRPDGARKDDDRAERLLGELKKRVQEISDGVVPLRPGRVYCYWCRSNACDHGGPRTPREVFIVTMVLPPAAALKS